MLRREVPGRSWYLFGHCAILIMRIECACFPPATKGESDVRLVSRLADGGRLVSSHGDGWRYLLRLDDAGYRLRQLADGAARWVASGQK